MAKQTSLSLIGRVLRSHCELVDSPISLGVWMRFEHGEHLDLARLTIDPKWYDSVTRFADDYSVVNLLSKYEGLNTGLDLKQEALSAFAAAEEQCRLTNIRIRGSREGNVSPCESVLHQARRKIAKILGRLDVAQVLQHCRWGPGGTFDIPRRHASSAYKNSKVLTVTPGALGYIRAWLESHPQWMESLCRAAGHTGGILEVQDAYGVSHKTEGPIVVGPYRCIAACFELVAGNRVVTVPKNAKTDRTIASEPTANSFLQQGVGRYIRKRLKRFGVDLDNQEVNQIWASLAHILDLATLDLKAASDTITRELIFELLPLDWALFLDSLRSPYYAVGGEWKRYHKFSSMGNAFTFELESMIFYALCESVLQLERCEGPVAVYGDDIIVPQGVAARVTEVLNWCGFAVNQTKSFTEGHFYESCGKHYFKGADVTPAYQKEQLDSGSIGSLIRGANRMFALAHRLGSGTEPHHGALAARGEILRAAGRYARTHVKPVSDGDDAFDFPEDHKYVRALKARIGPWGTEYHCKVLQPAVLQRRSWKYGRLAEALRDLGHDEQELSPCSDSLVRPASQYHTMSPYIRSCFLRIGVSQHGRRETHPMWGGVTQIEETEKLIERRRWIVPAR